MATLRRRACRALLVTPDAEILLVRITSPGQWDGWITPGGGVEPGESDMDALRRELREEVGFHRDFTGTEVWRRFHAFPWRDDWLEQEESFYLVRTERFEPSRDGVTATEREDLRDARWWTLDEIDASTDVFAPRRLAAYVRELLVAVPARPIEIEDPLES